MSIQKDAVAPAPHPVLNDPMMPRRPWRAARDPDAPLPHPAKGATLLGRVSEARRDSR
jgi:hypothetical protein